MKEILISNVKVATIYIFCAQNPSSSTKKIKKNLKKPPNDSNKYEIWQTL